MRYKRWITKEKLLRDYEAGWQKIPLDRKFWIHVHDLWTANGPVAIAETHPEGKYIVLENNPSSGVRKVSHRPLDL